jgi:hypothetical protein
LSALDVVVVVIYVFVVTRHFVVVIRSQHCGVLLGSLRPLQPYSFALESEKDKSFADD